MQSLKSHQILIHLKFSPISSEESLQAEQILSHHTQLKSASKGHWLIIWKGHSWPRPGVTDDDGDENVTS